MHGLLTPSMLLVSSTLLLSACTDTIYKEIPQYTVQPTAVVPTYQQQVPGGVPVVSPTGGNVVTVPNNMAGSGGTPVAPAVTSITPTTPINTAVVAPTQPTTTPQTPVGNGPFADGTNIPGVASPTVTQDLTSATAGMVIGIPGQAVDCQNKLPCRWISADAQFAVTATNADNIASRNRLSVSYSVSTIHDTQLVMGSVDDAVDTDLIRYQATDLTLADGNGGTPSTVQAGRDTLGVVNYNEGASAISLSYWSVALLDGGLIRKALFSGLPVGPVTSDYAQCNFSLPCVWASPDGQVTITLLSVGGFAGNGRMTANFNILGNRDMSIAADTGASAIGDDGTRFEGRTHTLSIASSHEKLTQESIANIGTSGAVYFYRTENTPSSLVHLSLVLYEDAPTPRWNPRFVSVPVQ